MPPANALRYVYFPMHEDLQFTEYGTSLGLDKLLGDAEPVARDIPREPDGVVSKYLAQNLVIALFYQGSDLWEMLKVLETLSFPLQAELDALIASEKYASLRLLLDLFTEGKQMRQEHMQRVATITNEKEWRKRVEADEASLSKIGRQLLDALVEVIFFVCHEPNMAEPYFVRRSIKEQVCGIIKRYTHEMSTVYPNHATNLANLGNGLFRKAQGRGFA